MENVEEIRYARQPIPTSFVLLPIGLFILNGFKIGTIGIISIPVIAILVFLLFYAKTLKDKPDICITIDDLGITDLRQNYGKILWKDIRSFSIYTFNNGKWLCLKLHNPKDYIYKLDTVSRLLLPLTRAVGTNSIGILTTGLEVDTESIYQMISARCAGNLLEKN